VRYQLLRFSLLIFIDRVSSIYKKKLGVPPWGKKKLGNTVLSTRKKINETQHEYFPFDIIWIFIELNSVIVLRCRLSYETGCDIFSGSSAGRTECSAQLTDFVLPRQALIP
jgi:hypothetical protein